MQDLDLDLDLKTEDLDLDLALLDLLQVWWTLIKIHYSFNELWLFIKWVIFWDTV